MSELHNNLLWFVVFWPLVWAIPMLNSVLPWPRIIAVVPALVLTMLPGQATVTLPPYLLGRSLATDSGNRWLLAMSVLLWLSSAILGEWRKRQAMREQSHVFFLLTMAGTLGLILATDLIGFYTFSALMGYGFYGLLLRGGHHSALDVGRIYIFSLVLADVLLLEAMLHIGLKSEDLRFETVHQLMSESASPAYVLLVLLGFGLKAAIWPAHFWLVPAYQVASRPTMILLGSVPVAMGLMGLTHWLPLGDIALWNLGSVVQWLGGMAVLYSGFRLFTVSSLNLIPGWTVILLSGVFMILTGTGLAYPWLWHTYEFLITPLIVFVGLIAGALSLMFCRRQMPFSPELPLVHRLDLLSHQIELGEKQLENKKLVMMARLNALRKAMLTTFPAYADRRTQWQRLSAQANRWSVKIMLFVVLGLILAFEAIT